MKRIIIGALIGASTIPAILLVGWAVSLLFNIEFGEAVLYTASGGMMTYMGAFFAKMTE